MKRFYTIVYIFSVLMLSCPASAQDAGPTTAILAIGDSLTAGTQDICTLEPTQRASWITQLAEQLKSHLSISYSFPALTIDGQRIDPRVLPTNVAIPGLELSRALFATDSIELIPGVPVEISPFITPIDTHLGLGNTTPIDALLYMLDHMKENGYARWVFIWIGMNDVFFDINEHPHITQDIINSKTTSLDQFTSMYAQLIGAIKAKSPDAIFVLTLPDITKTAFFLTPEELSFFIGKPISEDIIAKDSLIPLTSAFQTIVSAIPEEWVKRLDDSELLDIGEQILIQERIDAYNHIIQKIARDAGTYLIDMSSKLGHVLSAGATLNDGKRLTRSWSRGGLFSLDGIHPSHTGHAIIANVVIDFLNKSLNKDIRPLDITTIYQNDPYRDMDGDGYVPGPEWEAHKGSITELLHMLVDYDEES